MNAILKKKMFMNGVKMCSQLYSNARILCTALRYNVTPFTLCFGLSGCWMSITPVHLSCLRAMHSHTDFVQRVRLNFVCSLCPVSNSNDFLTYSILLNFTRRTKVKILNAKWCKPQNKLNTQKQSAMKYEILVLLH